MPLCWQGWLNVRYLSEVPHFENVGALNAGVLISPRMWGSSSFAGLQLKIKHQLPSLITVYSVREWDGRRSIFSLITIQPSFLVWVHLIVRVIYCAKFWPCAFTCSWLVCCIERLSRTRDFPVMWKCLLESQKQHGQNDSPCSRA